MLIIYRQLENVINGPRDVAWGNGQSRRFLVSDDKMGYSLTESSGQAQNRFSNTAATLRLATA